MIEKDIEQLLCEVKNGETSIEEAVLKLKEAPFEDMGFARPDFHRSLRQGQGEVIYGQGKTNEQIVEIAKKLLAHGQERVLITRMSKEASEYFKENMTSEIEDFSYDELSKVAVAGKQVNTAEGIGRIVVATGGTSDIPVAEEAAKTGRPIYTYGPVIHNE